MFKGTRKVPVQYAKRVIGNKAEYGEARQYIPLKVNAANVMPIIFALKPSCLSISIMGFANKEAGSFMQAFMDNTGFWYNFTCLLC